MRVFERVIGKNFSKETTFCTGIHKLWEDNIIWMRDLIVGVAAGIPNINVALDKLMQNQVEIGNAFKPFYGEAAGDKLTSLLKEHIGAAYDLILAAKAGDKSRLDAENRRWYANADDIAVLLSVANPKAWPAPAMKNLMKDHLDLTLAEANARLQGNWAEDISNFDKVHNQMLQLADTICEGIIGQFPAKFR